MKIGRVLFLFLLTSQVQAQIEVRPILSTSTSNQRTKDSHLDTLQLPFWDDFSGSVGTANPALWLNTSEVQISPGTGLDAPSINVATFDGINAFGIPYGELQAVGLTDSLISMALDLSVVTPTETNTVYLSFFVQKSGFGELPNEGDSLSLYFLTTDTVWTRVWPLTEADIPRSSVGFEQKLIKVDAQYFHEGFQFKFQSFGRQDGPFDSWNIDYIFLNKGRSSIDRFYNDRAIASLPTPIFKRYTAYPLKQFFAHPDPESLLDTTSFQYINLQSQIQPSNYFIEVRDRSTGNLVQMLADNEGFPAEAGTRVILKDSTDLLDIILLDSLADSVYLDLKYYVTTEDTLLADSSYTVGPEIFYTYSDFDLRINDTIQTSFIMDDYFAYDDGSAEFAAGTNQNGATLVQQYILSTPSYIDQIDFYFPIIKPDPNGLPMDIVIYSGLGGSEEELLLKKANTVRTSSALNEYQTYFIQPSVPVEDTIYVGLRQGTGGFFPVGLDKNSLVENRIFSNVFGSWEMNQSVSGSLMIRPHLGDGQDVILGTSEQEFWDIGLFPNPSKGVVNISGVYDEVKVFNTMGQNISPQETSNYQYKTLNFALLPDGIYIVQIAKGNRRTTRKIILLR